MPEAAKAGPVRKAQGENVALLQVCGGDSKAGYAVEKGRALNMAEAVVKDAAWWTEWHLQNWRDWMHRGELPEGMPTEACGGAENYTTYDANSERAYTALDAWAAECTHMVVDGLDASEQAAIHHAYLNAVYRFMRGNYLSLLTIGRLKVQAGLRRRGVWLGE